MLRRIRQFVLKSTLLRICNAIVLSHFDYCSLVWDNCCEYLTDKLQKLQNRAARIITGNVHILNQMYFGKHKKVHWKQHDAFFLIYYHKTD